MKRSCDNCRYQNYCCLDLGAVGCRDGDKWNPDKDTWQALEAENKHISEMLEVEQMENEKCRTQVNVLRRAFENNVPLAARESELEQARKEMQGEETH